MTNKAIILGTSHDIQRNEIHGVEFYLLVNHLIKKHGVKAIAEEICPDDDPIAKQIAAEKGLEHLIIEPTLAEKEQLGIDDPGRIAMLLDMGAQEPGEESSGLNEAQKIELEQRTQQTYRQREAEWFRRITDKNIWPVLVICGAKHYEPFISLLKHNDIDVEECGMYVSTLK